MNLTIEHIMPQRWAKNWPLLNEVTASHESIFAALVNEVPMDDQTKTLVDTRSAAVDTLGNLTLLTNALNPSLSNAGWKVKREKLSDSLLALNRMVAKNEAWNESTLPSSCSEAIWGDFKAMAKSDLKLAASVAPTVHY